MTVYTKFFKVAIIAGLLQATAVGRTVQFMYFERPANAPETVFMFQTGSDEATEVELTNYNFSQAYEIADGDVVLKFLPSIPEADAEFPKFAPTIKIPASWQKVLILSYTDASNGKFPINFQPLNASPSNFGVGDTMFFNSSPMTIYGRLGKKKLVLKPNSAVISKNRSTTEREYFVNLRQTNDERTEDYRFLTKTFRHYSDQRKIMFIYSSGNDKSARYFVTTIR